MIGVVSMDSTTVSLPEDAQAETDFYVIKDDIYAINSVPSIAAVLNTCCTDVCSALSIRLPRVYVRNGECLK